MRASSFFSPENESFCSSIAEALKWCAMRIGGATGERYLRYYKEEEEEEGKGEDSQMNEEERGVFLSASGPEVSVFTNHHHLI